MTILLNYPTLSHVLQYLAFHLFQATITINIIQMAFQDHLGLFLNAFV